MYINPGFEKWQVNDLVASYQQLQPNLTAEQCQALLWYPLNRAKKEHSLSGCAKYTSNLAWDEAIDRNRGWVLETLMLKQFIDITEFWGSYAKIKGSCLSGKGLKVTNAQTQKRQNQGVKIGKKRFEELTQHMTVEQVIESKRSIAKRLYSEGKTKSLIARVIGHHRAYVSKLIK